MSGKKVVSWTDQSGRKHRVTCGPLELGNVLALARHRDKATNLRVRETKTNGNGRAHSVPRGRRCRRFDHHKVSA